MSESEKVEMSTADIKTVCGGSRAEKKHLEES